MRPQARQIVGQSVGRDPNELLRTNLDRNNYPVSNNIGVGILSYNRHTSLRRLIDSIIRNTDLRRTTVFISDDASNDPATQQYLAELTNNPNFIVIRNDERLGIAGNSNRLLRCLSRFRYGLVLNDDVEILNRDWEYFYPEVMNQTGLHHLMYRQKGVYGADRGVSVQKNGTTLLRVEDKPHGAILAFDDSFLKTVGYFDESFGLYGMEHVDWSQRAWELGLQETGFFDASGSDSFFHLYAESSAVQDRPRLLQEARAKFAGRRAFYIAPSASTLLPEIAYVIPFRNFERTASIQTVVNNLRAQRFPVVHLVMVEQDDRSRIDLSVHKPVGHYLATAPDNPLFNKSRAFNLGVAKAPCEMVILHDADMLAQGHYTQVVAGILKDHESCHIGSTVMYTNQDSTQKINDTGIVDHQAKCDRVVGYYEGGSLAVTKKGYWKVGGFNEDYWGYGCFVAGAPLVLADGSIMAIDKVEEGQEVITHNGNLAPVVMTMARQYRGPAYRMKLGAIGYRYTLTNNHPVRVLRDSELVWVEAKDLVLGDLVQTRFSHQHQEDVSEIDVAATTGNDYQTVDGLLYPVRSALNHARVVDGSAIGLQPTLPVDDDLLDLIGYYAAEGCASPKNGLRFSVCEDEFEPGDIGHNICQILSRLGLNYRINRRGGGRGRDIQVFCLPLVRLFKTWFPQTKNAKKFPKWVMLLPPDKQRRVLAALVLGDGYIDHRRRVVRLRMGSEHLVSQAMNIAQRSGCTIRHYYTHLRKRYHVFELNMPFSGVNPDLCRLLELAPPADFRPAFSSFNPVVELIPVEYDGVVYNITVAGDHSYVVGGGVMKNCEDCDFYARLSGASKWKEDRVFDFLHLWHSRVGGWNGHHEANKVLERSLKSLDMSARVEKQRQQLRRLGYVKELEEALS